MYKEVPFISVPKPVLAANGGSWPWKSGRRALIVFLAAAAVAVLVACPLPLRVDGDAVVAPGLRATG